LAYQPLKNDKGQMYSLGHDTRVTQKGRWEYLLCEACEKRLNDSYETPFKKIWMDTIPPDFTMLDVKASRPAVTVSLPDFAAFKLFHLSVLWRAAVSGFTNDPAISLGKYQDELRALVLSGDPGEPGHFPIIAALSIDANKRPVGTVAPLAHGTGRFEGHHYYMMSYAYCDWIFIIARPGPAWLTEIEVKCRVHGEFPVLVISHTQSKSFHLWVDTLRRLRA